MPDPTPAEQRTMDYLDTLVYITAKGFSVEDQRKIKREISECETSYKKSLEIIADKKQRRMRSKLQKILLTQ